MKSLINPPELFPNLEKSAGASQSIVHCQVVICGHRLGFHRVERSLSSPAVVSDHARAVQFTTKPSGREGVRRLSAGWSIVDHIVGARESHNGQKNSKERGEEPLTNVF